MSSQWLIFRIKKWIIREITFSWNVLVWLIILQFIKILMYIRRKYHLRVHLCSVNYSAFVYNAKCRIFLLLKNLIWVNTCKGGGIFMKTLIFNTQMLQWHLNFDTKKFPFTMYMKFSFFLLPKKKFLVNCGVNHVFCPWKD